MKLFWNILNIKPIILPFQSTAIYQARQKLDSIQKSKENPVSSEELIKYAHRISASNAVSAPLNWQQGDPRRPYPTDMEMRLGLLGRTEQVALEMSRNAQASGERGSRTPVVGGTTPGTGTYLPTLVCAYVDFGTMLTETTTYYCYD